MRILAICGSLQAGSTNDALLAAAADQISGDLMVERSISTAEVPAFNPDLERDAMAPPATVAILRSQVARADAVLIATPEYAHSLPGALKNALDWLVGSGDLYAKPVAIVAGSPRADGAQRARDALEQTLRAQGAAIVVSTTIEVPSLDFRSAGLTPAAVDAIGAVVGQLSAAVTSALG